MVRTWDSLGVRLVKIRNRDCEDRKERVNVKAKVQNFGVGDGLCDVPPSLFGLLS